MRATQRSVGFLTASLVGVSLVAANVGASTKPAAVPMAFSVPQDVTALQTVLTHYQVPRLPRPGMVEWLEISERGSSGTFGQPAKWTMLRRVRVARAGRGVVALKPLGIGEWPLQAKLLGPSGKLLVESPIDNIRAYGSVTFGALCKSGAATCQGGQTTVVESRQHALLVRGRRRAGGHTTRLRHDLREPVHELSLALALDRRRLRRR